jgi:nucleoside-diphosphate-sugar epimerase
MSDPTIRTIEELDERLSEPSPGAIETMRALEGDVILLGVAGKMGPTLARMVKRASAAAGVQRRVIGVSRFSDARHESELTRHGVETIRCDLLEENAVEQLPAAPNVLYLAGMKFGATGQEAKTWAMNAYLPATVCKKYRDSKIVAFSTGNVYGLTPVTGGGSRETDAPNPVGEYAMSCLGRERMFEHFSRSNGTPVALIRLNYACELRYGVLVDLAQKVWAGQPVDVSMGGFNIIWQGDANAMTIEALRHVQSPPLILNLTGPEILSIRAMSERFGKLMGREVQFRGAEADTALLSNAGRAFELFGKPRVQTEQLLQWIAQWVMNGGPSLGKPTHFESRDGKF